MERMEYRVDDNVKNNRIGISVKNPDGVREKWSEPDVWIKCAECGSKNLRTHLSGDAIVIACMDCPNYWEGPAEEIIGYYDTEEAYASIFGVDQFDEVPREEREDVV